MYWPLDPDCSTTIVRHALSRQKLTNIKMNLHVNDNYTTKKRDKLFKIRPLCGAPEQKLLVVRSSEDKLSTNEQMIPYRGRHSTRMFMKGKSIRCGYTAWALASSDGYAYAFNLYTGKSSKEKILESSFGLGGNVVVDLLQTVKKEYHAVYFDNFFAVLIF